MGRGKKKGKKPVEESLSSLSLADEPSSSTAATAAPGPSAPPTVAQPTAVEPPAVAPPPQKEETPEAEEGGLGLGPTKKRVRPKKKPAGAAAAAAAAAAASAAAAPSAVPTVVEPGPAGPSPQTAGPTPSQPGPAPGSAGTGRGWGKGRGQGDAVGQQAPPHVMPQAPVGFPQQPSMGHPQQPPMGYPQQPPMGHPQQPPMGHPQQPPMGYPQQPPMGYPQQPPMGHPQQPLMGYPQQPPMGHPQQPSMGHPQQPPMVHPQQPQMGYPQQLPMGHPQQPPMGYPQQPPPGYRGPSPPYQEPVLPPQPTPQSAPAGPSQSQAKAPETKPAQQRPATTERNLPLQPTKCKFNIPKRIEGNSIRSQKMPVSVNYLKMNIKAMTIYRYDVNIHPDRPKKVIPKVFMMALEQHFPKTITQFVAFDQMKNFYSVEKLPKITTTERFVMNVLIYDENKREMKFEVSIKMTGTVDLKTIMQYMADGGSSLNPPAEAIQCIDVVLRQGTLSSYVKAGRQFFKRPSRPIVLGEGVEMWTGLFQSAIFTSRPFINIDVAHKGFPIHQPMIDLIKQMDLDFTTDLRKQNTKLVRGRNKFDAFSQYIKGLRVIAYVGGDTSNTAVRREFICNEIVAPPGDPSMKFPYKDSKDGKERMMTVQDYFANIKKYKIKYPNLNCMWVGPRDKKIYVPMELLDVAYGQVRNRQLSDDQIREMIKVAATPPDERRFKIDEVIRDMHYNTNPYFRKFGLEIDNQFTKVEGKLLNVPKLKCVGNTDAVPRKGVWNSRGFLQGATLQSWSILCLARRDQFNDQELISSMTKFGKEMGMSVSPPMPTKYDVQTRDLNSHMQGALSAKSQLIIVIVPNWVPNCYAQVKKVAELHVGVLTQCLKLETVTKRLNAQTVKNILLKVNSKLMGISHSIDKTYLPLCMRSGPFMAVGADVTHPSPEQTNIPSIAAVTASYEAHCFKYNIELSIQTPKKEIIVQFEEMMVAHLRLFNAHNRCLPNQIFVFRDGVSEGHFAEVLNSELVAIYNAYATVAADKTKKPRVLFLVVQKRHHTRFFLDKSRDNVEPGTCVDTDIVHPRELDFYMVSHQAIKGTARPTRYHVIANDANLPHDEVEQMTYYLCHMFSRCNRAVSYPTPTYYAHLACTRAKALTFGDQFDNKQLETTPKRIVIKPAVKDNNQMFFV